ncbi:hypothetical protein ICV01_06245 [Polynucleobacter sp. MWH-Spelu-300-X4]|uniref:hypothetical protein n=1 Tax=Polynucleobacter sp. MWH-Spelu-300-X4 TaxID=2689109 RepID=UPI001BFE569E|nr:hypothetical protein [Polynucleobacter sp. MWH-Spelu-300-X4]QWD79248.1 hypothetical protein ICV01_06245 [Polynucleobacter sp. MWH-Spelu-300-X4]
MDNSTHELLSQRIIGIKKEFFEVKKSFNAYIYEFAQINIWLFLGVVGSIGISDVLYKTWALVMTGVFFVYQIFIFNRLKISHQVNKDHLATLLEEIESISLEFKKIGYEKKKSDTFKEEVKELDFFWAIISPLFLNWGFYMYILYTHLSNVFVKT